MKLSSYENPISGEKGNLFDLGKVWSEVLGVAVLVMIFIFGQKIADFFFPPVAGTVAEPVTTVRFKY
jgi:hypothetical protein